MALAPNDSESSLNEAFATNDLRLICRAVDAAVVQSGSAVEIARAAGLDRVTLYRAFRLERGPGFETMTKVLRVLGFQLVVDLRDESGAPASPRRKTRRAAASARRFTAALEAGMVKPLLDAFLATLRAQGNVAEFAKKTTVSRENLYRVFSRNTNPRFGTLVSVLNAWDLRFGVRPLQLKVPLAPIADESARPSRPASRRVREDSRIPELA